jgi:DegV family protein with EDD domain
LQEIRSDPLKKVLISSDSCCDLFPDLYKKYNINIIPLYISIEGKSLRDQIEINPEDIYLNVEATKKIPKTAAPTPTDFSNSFKPYLDEGYEIVHLSINSNFSCSYQNACIAAAELKGVYVIDTLTISTAMGLLVIKAAQMRDSGISAAEIAKKLEEIKSKPNTSFLLDNLEYAHKGGRCSTLQMLGANLLRLRPCLHVDQQGIIKVIKTFRGNFAQAIVSYTKYMLEQLDIDYSRVFISHTGMAKELLDKVINMVKAEGKFKEILVTTTGCTIACHGGPNTLAVFYMKN